MGNGSCAEVQIPQPSFAVVNLRQDRQLSSPSSAYVRFELPASVEPGDIASLDVVVFAVWRDGTADEAFAPQDFEQRPNGPPNLSVPVVPGQQQYACNVTNLPLFAKLHLLVLARHVSGTVAFTSIPAATLPGSLEPYSLTLFPRFESIQPVPGTVVLHTLINELLPDTVTQVQAEIHDVFLNITDYRRVDLLRLSRDNTPVWIQRIR